MKAALNNMNFMISLFIFVPSRLINTCVSIEKRKEKERNKKKLPLRWPQKHRQSNSLEFLFSANGNELKTLGITTARIIKGIFPFPFFLFKSFFIFQKGGEGQVSTSTYA